ncbi:MAG: hypothetical protein JRG96_14930 [Deltaproteobacteria bacterium]|nr:hypothetical protein [Deltaproteobacteria bacterium]
MFSRPRAGSLGRDYIIDLVTTCPHFGGPRWWFRCPLSGCRVRKLYAHPSTGHFASRQTLGLTYQVCREEPLDHAARRAREPGVPSLWATGLPTLSGVT